MHIFFLENTLLNGVCHLGNFQMDKFIDERETSFMHTFAM